MSVFNGEAFLAEAIDSILCQTFRNFEFVVVDDGSTDTTAEILARYSKSDGRLQIFAQQNKGRATSLNWGIQIARGRYIARMDADDIALPYRLAEQFEFMDRQPELGLLGGGVELVSPDRRRLGRFQPPVVDREIRSAMRRYNPFYHPTVMMRREVVQAVGGYRKALLDADDYDLFLRMAEHSRVANLERSVLLYRIHPNQVTVRNMTHQALCILAGRAAASLRSHGAHDPLWEAAEVTPQLVQSLGVTAEEIRKETVGEHLHWMRLLAEVDPGCTLRLIDRLLELCSSDPAGRSVATEALLKAADIHYRHRRFAKALACAGRGVLIQPMAAGRIAKMALARRAATFSSQS
jgi:hypothetical protein